MKYLLIIPMVLVVNMIFSQTKLEFNVVDNCSEKMVDEYNIWVIPLDRSTKKREYWINKDSIYTIEKGIYSIYISVTEGEFYRTHNFVKGFKADSLYSVNLELPRIMKKRIRNEFIPTDLGFYYCDKICEGEQKDFFSNGKLRMEGRFKNGIPLEKIKKYNESGDLTEIEFYNQDGTYNMSTYPYYKEHLKN